MLASTLNMHYTLATPSNFGICDYDVSLPCYSFEKRVSDQTFTENILASLSGINPARLSDADAYSYTLLKRSLENSLAMSKYSYYEEPLSPASGMQSQFPILLAEYTFRCRQDVEDYLALLDQTDEYFDSLLVFEQEKAKAGLLMPAASLEKVKNQCDTIVTEKALTDGTHFLQSTFAERLQKLNETETLQGTDALSSEEIKNYLAQNDRLLKTVVLPSYEKLADGLFVLEDASIPLAGLAAKPQGRDYYEFLLRSQTGSYRSIPEIQQLLAQAFRTEYEHIHALAAEHSDLLQAVSPNKTGNFPLTQADDMLHDLQNRMQHDFPVFPGTLGIPNTADTSATINSSNTRSTSAAPTVSSQMYTSDAPENIHETTLETAPYHHNSLLSDSNPVYSASHAPAVQITNNMPSVTVKPVSPSLEEYCAPAFYLTAPLDDTDNNVIYINEKNSPSGLELYTTLAHEGYPGHLYQTVYSNRYFLENGENNVREILWYGGYQEGWAVYVEFRAFDYASSLMQEQNLNADSVLIQLEKHNRSLQLCLYSLLDIMIHYDNASYAQVADVLDKFGISNPAATKAIYTYIAEEPCNYLKYYLGYLEILELQKETKELWGDNYSDYAFHKFYLDCGPSDFTSLSERLHSSETSPLHPASGSNK